MFGIFGLNGILLEVGDACFLSISAWLLDLQGIAPLLVDFGLHDGSVFLMSGVY